MELYSVLIIQKNLLTLQFDNKINNKRTTTKETFVRRHLDKVDDAETLTALVFKDGINSLKTLKAIALIHRIDSDSLSKVLTTMPQYPGYIIFNKYCLILVVRFHFKTITNA